MKTKKIFFYISGIITGIILTVVVSLYINLSNNKGIIGLEIFEEPGHYMEYSHLNVFQVVERGCALAHVDNSLGTIVFIIPNDEQKFYDNQKIVLKRGQYAQRIGTYKYSTRNGVEKTVPAVRIIDTMDLTKSKNNIAAEHNSGKTLFAVPGDCISQKNFEIQEVLESGDAIALEIREIISGHIFTSELKVLILAQEGKSFYNNQIVKVSQGKYARHIGNYKYQQYGKTEVIPIVTFK